MQTLFEYIEQLKQKQELRIKIAAEVTDEMMDKIERHLEKYDAEKVSAPSKTIMMNRPLDFPNHEQVEVYIIDFTSGLPVSSEMLHQEIARLLNLPEGSVVVRGVDDARELEQEEQEKEKPYKSKLENNYSKEELSEVKPDQLAGDKYNGGLLKELKKISDEKKKALKNPKVVKDPDVPLSAPEIGDSKSTHKVSPVAKRG